MVLTLSNFGGRFEPEASSPQCIILHYTDEVGTIMDFSNFGLLNLTSTLDGDKKNEVLFSRLAKKLDTITMVLVHTLKLFHALFAMHSTCTPVGIMARLISLTN